MNKTEKVEAPAEAFVLPFLKWAGGKRWLAPHVAELLQAGSGRYLEPFVGSAAIFFAARPKRALLSDINGALMETYRCVRDQPHHVLELLLSHQGCHSAAYYYKVRSSLPTTEVARAARFIYLNRTCWNGLYRVNRRGEFNVPIGTKTAVVLESDSWECVADLLSGAQLLTQDFEVTINEATEGDIVFADPPYTVKHNFNGFIKYNESLFSWDDQVRLRDALRRANERGVVVVATNADHPSVRDLYKGVFSLQSLERPSVLAGDVAFRGRFSELLITTAK